MARHNNKRGKAIPNGEAQGKQTSVVKATDRVPSDRRVVSLSTPVGPAGARNSSDGPGEGSVDLLQYVRILREHWIMVAAAFAIVTAGVALGTLMKAPVYRATTTIEVRREAAPAVTVESYSQADRVSDQYLQTQYTMLRSRGLLQRVVSDPGLASGLMTALEMDAGALGGGDSLSREALRVKLAEYIRKRLTVDPVTGSRITRVSVEMEDPVLAATIVNEVAAAYMSMRGEARREAVERLAAQADSVRQQILEAERFLREFVVANGLGAVVGEGVGETVPQERLRRLQQELTEAEAEAYQTASMTDTAGVAVTGLADSDLLERLRTRIAELEGEYARLRSTFTDSFPRTRQVKRELDQLDSLVAEEEGRLRAAVQEQHRATLRRREMLRSAVAVQREQLDRIAAAVSEYNRLRRDLERQEGLYGTLEQKRKEAEIAAGLSGMDAAILDPATIPLSPVSPLPKRDIPLGAMAGLMLGIGLAFVRHYADRSVRSVEDVEGMTDAPVLAMIPAEGSIGRPRVGVIGKNGSDHWYRIDRLGPSHAALKEAFSALRTSMLYDVSGLERRTLLITSSQPNEGKTTVSTNLAISLARLGRRVLLVDADIRRPSLHRVFTMTPSEGLSEYLDGEADWPDLVHSNVVPGLDVLQAGIDEGSPADQLSSERTLRLLAETEEAYDFVLLDAPALFIAVPDARILAHLVEGVILVVRSGMTTREVVQQLVGQVDNLVGVVLNDMDTRSMPGYYRNYQADEATGDSLPAEKRTRKSGYLGTKL